MIASAFTIYEKAETLVTQLQTRNPEKIIKSLNIPIFENEFEKLLGMYTAKWGVKLIVVNSLMSEELRRMVLAHELGHDQLHCEEAAKGGFQEFSLIHKTGTIEYEANAFCAHLLIPNEELFEYFEEGKTIEEIASYFGVDINIVAIKIKELKKMGYNVRELYDYNSCFFKKKSPLG